MSSRPTASLYVIAGEGTGFLRFAISGPILRSCASAAASHAPVAFSIDKNNRKQWMGDRDDFIHLQVAVFARPK
jgi:hypothetical protein